MSGEQIVLR